MFYPEDFVPNFNGKRYAWQGMALLPVIEEPQLLDALDLAQPTFALEERKPSVPLQPLPEPFTTFATSPH